MAKNRVIPFGYCMKNGEITVDFAESKAVIKIFEEYLGGISLMQIAKLMESEKVQYSEGSDRWNKNMVKRIIENEKYLGNDKYPKIISGKFFTQANEKRMSKATSVSVIPEDLQEIRNRTYCLECGHRLSRIGGNCRCTKWDCRNPDCYRLEYQLTDQMIIGAVLTTLNTVIANPSLIESNSEISVYSPTADVIRKQNEISQMTDSAQVDFDRIKSEIFKLAEMKYGCCSYDESLYKTAQIRGLLENHEQLNSLDIGLFKSCINRIWISHFCIIEVEFFIFQNPLNLAFSPECQGQEEIISIENRLKEIDRARNDLVSLIAFGGCDEDKLDSEFSRLYQEEQQLSERLEMLKSQNKTSAETQAKLDKIMDMIEHEKFELETFDNVLIRKLIECVKVLSKSEILVIFKGGYEVKTDIE